MRSPTVSELHAVAPGHDILKEEAARYALLRRIAPAIRHHLAGTLQPISMISAIMERRLQAPAPDLVVLRDNSKSISTLSRTAAGSAMNLITWVAPKDNGMVPLQAGAEECLGMLSTDLAFRGFNVSNQISNPEVNVSVFALRTVFTACLIAVTDAAQAPARIEITSEPAGEHTRVCIRVASEDGAAEPDAAGSYRKLEWDDVEALATAEAVSVRHSATHAEMLFVNLAASDLTT